jgi:hypothetical protein
MGIQGGGGGGGGAQQGYQYNQSLSQQAQNLWAPNAQALQGLYGQATNLMGQQGNMQGVAQNVLKGAMGGGALGQYAQPNNQLAAQQLQDYSSQVGQNFNREILPGIRGQAGRTGNMGGSRAALAQGVAAGDAASAIAQQGRGLYADQYGIGAQAAAHLPQAISQMYNLGMAPYSAAWAPLSSAAGIFGGPTVLSTGQTQAFGEDWNRGTQKGTKPSWGFSLG